MDNQNVLLSLLIVAAIAIPFTGCLVLTVYSFIVSRKEAILKAFQQENHLMVAHALECAKAIKTQMKTKG